MGRWGLQWHSPTRKAELSAEELSLSARALLKNAKCYGAWHHRVWVLDLGAANAADELRVCAKMLAMDARNCKREEE